MARRPSIPEEAAGLVGALAAHRGGDPYPLVLWHSGPRDRLRGALESWCGDTELADATTACIVAAAFRAGLAKSTIRDELAWMSAVAAHHLEDLTRARGRALALAMRFASGKSEVSATSNASDEPEDPHVRVLAAIVLLPSPYAQAMTLRHVKGMTNRQVGRWLMDWNPITSDGTRYILKEGRKMLEFVLKGGDPRKQWSRRFRKKSRWNSTPPTTQRRQ